MPIVFVHGVATRLEPGLWRDLEARKTLMRAFLYEPLGLGPQEPRFAYWGQHGATFRWGHASLPSGKDEAFGGTDGMLGEVVAEHADLDDAPAEAFVVDVARRKSLEEALDLLFVAAAEGATSQEADNLAEVAVAVSRWLSSGHAQIELEAVRGDVDFVNLLALEVPTGQGEDEVFGSAQDGWVRLREKLDRIGTIVPAVTGGALGKVIRPRLNHEFATFIGDVLVYLERTGRQGAKADILQAVGDEIEAALEQRTEEDPLVVIAHSMGGNIVYDLFSHYRPDLHCDTLVTVGSQVGLFQELDLFAAKHLELAPPAKVPRPDTIGRWINVYDRNDFLGFAAERVFDGVEDFAYPTGKGLLKAHSSYFVRPSFYSRLAARLTGGR